MGAWQLIQLYQLLYLRWHRWFGHRWVPILVQHDVLVHELFHHVFNVKVRDALLPIGDRTDEVILESYESVLEIDTVIVPVDNSRRYLEELEHLDKPPIPDVATAYDNHAVLFPNVLENFRPHKEIGFGEVQFAKVFRIVHVEHPDINVGRPADSIVAGLIQDVDLLFEQNAVNDAKEGPVEPMVVENPVGDDPTAEETDYEEVDALKIHGEE